jgi:hypothetical protein
MLSTKIFSTHLRAETMTTLHLSRLQSRQNRDAQYAFCTAMLFKDTAQVLWMPMSHCIGVISSSFKTLSWRSKSKKWRTVSYMVLEYYSYLLDYRLVLHKAMLLPGRIYLAYIHSIVCTYFPLRKWQTNRGKCGKRNHAKGLCPCIAHVRQVEWYSGVTKDIKYVGAHILKVRTRVMLSVTLSTEKVCVVGCSGTPVRWC